MEAEKRGNHAKKVSKKFNLYNIFVGLTLVLGAILIINIFLTINLNKEFEKSAEAAKEAIKPAKIELAVIKNSKCSDCFDISTIVGHIKNVKLNVTKETAYEFDSARGKELITKYKITKIPTLIATGEIGKVNVQGLVKNGDALLFTQPEPPFTNAATGKIEGRVTLYNLVDSACTQCKDLSSLIMQIKGAGIKISEQKNITPSSDEGKNFINKYKIGFVPIIILSKDAAAYDVMQKAWLQVGSKEPDGSYVLRLAAPPFVNLTTGKLMGVVDVIYLTDKSCADCYDVNLHKEILTNPQSFAVQLGKEETFDASDAKGKELIAAYNITKVPTVILSNDISVYPSSQFLKQFYSIEKNGYYVFRILQSLGAYKDLTTNQVVKAPQRTQVQ